MNYSYSLINNYVDYFKSIANSCIKSTGEWIPLHHRKGIALRVGIAAAAVLPLLYIRSYIPEHQRFTYTHCAFSIIAVIDYYVLSKLWNNRTQEINQAIEQSKTEKREGIALILNASKYADHNFAFADSDLALSEFAFLSKRFRLESKRVSNSKQLVDAINEVCNTSILPIKVVVIRGHGALKSIDLGWGKLQANDEEFIKALNKTDAAAHIILESCSTAKLRSESGISLADQLSLNVPGRMVTGHSNDSGSMLFVDDRYPQGVTLYSCISTGWKTAKFIPSHSFCVEGNKRRVRIIAPFETKEDKENLAKEYLPLIAQDSEYKTENLVNVYEWVKLGVAK